MYRDGITFSINKRAIVFRVEHKRNLHGPYCASKVQIRSQRSPNGWKSLGTKKAQRLEKLLLDAHENSEHHPALLGNPDCHRCGFYTLSELLDWFDGFLEELPQAGYVIRVYSAIVSHAIEGQQLVYEALGASRIATFTFEEVKDLTGFCDKLQKKGLSMQVGLQA